MLNVPSTIKMSDSTRSLEVDLPIIRLIGFPLENTPLLSKVKVTSYSSRNNNALKEAVDSDIIY